jgi:hypothetical protein
LFPTAVSVLPKRTGPSSTMAELSINSEHKECDRHAESICGECQEKALRIAQNTILPLNFSVERLRDLIIEAADHLPRELRGKVNSVILTARMQLDESWASIREIWDHPAGRCSHSSGYTSLDLYTPPRSRSHSLKQGASSEKESDEGILRPHTPLSELFESLHPPNYIGAQQAVKEFATDPFTASDVPMPLFTRGSTGSANLSQHSKLSFLNRNQTPPYSPEKVIIERHRTMEYKTRERPSLAETQPLNRTLTGESKLSSNHDNSLIPLRKRDTESAPSPTGPFLSPTKIQYRKPLQDPVLRIIKEINLDLIRCYTLIQVDDPMYLDFADNALARSEEDGIYHSVTKSHLYRGLCLMKLKRWKEASSAFTRAASVRDWEGKAWELKNIAESNLLQESRGGNARMGILEESWDDHYR